MRHRGEGKRNHSRKRAENPWGKSSCPFEATDVGMNFVNKFVMKGVTMTDINIKKERRRGMRKMLWIILALFFGCCDIHIANVRVWYSPVSQVDDYLRGEKAQREAGKRNYERIYRERKEAERKSLDSAGEP